MAYNNHTQPQEPSFLDLLRNASTLDGSSSSNPLPPPPESITSSPWHTPPEAHSTPVGDEDADAEGEYEIEDEDGEYEEEEEDDEEADAEGETEGEDQMDMFREGAAEDDDIPADVGRQMDEATADVGGSIPSHADILWEVDENDLRELDNEMDIDDWDGKKGKRKRKRVRKEIRNKSPSLSLNTILTLIRIPLETPKLTKTRAFLLFQGPRRKKTDLSPELAEVVGKANLAYTQSDYSQAFKLLHEVIRNKPSAYQAWATLAMMHDELGHIDKALKTYLMVAHLSPSDSELWKRCGTMSRKLGHIDQAIYCYTKAIRLDPADVDSLWDRSLLFKEQRKLQKAIDGFQAILAIIPYNMPAVKELSKIHLELKDFSKAIALFEGAMQADVDNPLPLEDEDDEEHEIERDIGIGGGRHDPAPHVRMGYEEINMLAELYIEAGEYAKAWSAIVQGVQRIQRIGNGIPVTAGTAMVEDEELATGDLPLELRVKLGVCRLWLGQPDAAATFFRPLYASRVEEYGELYFDVAEAYMNKRMFTQALAVFDALTNCEQTDIPAAWKQMAQCYQQLGNMETAAELYTSVLEVMPNDVDVKLALAEVYEEMGEEDRALQLVSEVDAHARETAATTPDRNSTGTPDSGAPADRSFIQTATATQRRVLRSSKRAGTTRAEKDQAILEAEEQARCREHRAAYQKMVLLYERARTDRISRADRSKVFVSVKRKKHSRGFDTNEGNGMGLQEVLWGVNCGVGDRPSLNSDSFLNKDAEIARPPRPTETSFEGLNFDEWYDAFVKFAMMATLDGKEDDAQSWLKTAFDANVYYHDETRRVKLKLHMMAAAIYAGNAIRVAELCRWFCQYKPLANDTLRMFAAMQTGSSEAVSCYAMAPVQKYFLRQIRIMDREAAKHPEAPEYRNPLILTTYAHILHAARSYASAISFYIRAYRMAPDDPLINLSIGIAHIHRAMQRKSDNRHQLVMQGITFLMRYCELRGGGQEAWYNIARGFHQLRLTHLAVPYYEKVIAAPASGNDDSLNLKREAGYNLSLIYISGGLFGLAQAVLREHCRALRQLRDGIHHIDVVVEVRDARIPLTSINPAFEEILGKRDRLVVYNKSDLANPHLRKNVVEALGKYRGEKDIIFTTAARGTGVKGVIEYCIEKCRRQPHLYPYLSVVVVGMPNVGKSTLMNTLRRLGMKKGKVSEVGMLAGVTRTIQTRVKIWEDPPIYLVDTPGIFDPHFTDPLQGLKIALTGERVDRVSVSSFNHLITLNNVIMSKLGGTKDQMTEEVNVVDYLLFRLNNNPRLRKKYPEVLGLPGPSDDINEVLRTIAARENLLSGIVDGQQKSTRLEAVSRGAGTSPASKLRQTMENGGHRLVVHDDVWGMGEELVEPKNAKGETLDLDMAARHMLRLYREGALGAMTLDDCQPDELQRYFETPHVGIGYQI
ncbi:transcription factor TFIIIC subunit tfc4 [Borealophlyctis nickersoniae]|nr:transcription factor TFIIIC subunit tfc4 [Borealophlyctis nickersoniae]